SAPATSVGAFPILAWGDGPQDASTATLRAMVEDTGVKRLIYLHDYGHGWEQRSGSSASSRLCRVSSIRVLSMPADAARRKTSVASGVCRVPRSLGRPEPCSPR